MIYFLHDSIIRDQQFNWRTWATVSMNETERRGQWRLDDAWKEAFFQLISHRSLNSERNHGFISRLSSARLGLALVIGVIDQTYQIFITDRPIGWRRKNSNVLFLNVLIMMWKVSFWSQFSSIRGDIWVSSKPWLANSISFVFSFLCLRCKLNAQDAGHVEVDKYKADLFLMLCLDS